jgi:hypothetical protein
LEIKNHPPTMCETPPQVTQVWKMYFDGASSKECVGSRVVFISPCQEVTSLSYKLEFEVWDLIDNFFLDFNISFVPREENVMVDSLVVSASNFKIPLPPKLKYDVEVKYRPSIPDNVKHWKVFEDDIEINIFLETVE